MYKRVTKVIRLEPFSLAETERLLRGNGVVLTRREVTEAHMVFGGVPYYLRPPNRRYGLNQYMDVPCFARHGHLCNELDARLRALFRHFERHGDIVYALATRQPGIGRKELLVSHACAGRRNAHNHAHRTGAVWPHPHPQGLHARCIWRDVPAHRSIHAVLAALRRGT